MKKSILLVILLIMQIGLSAQEISIIPEPIFKEVNEGVFLLNSKTKLVAIKRDGSAKAIIDNSSKGINEFESEFENSISFLNNYLSTYYNYSFNEVGSITRGGRVKVNSVVLEIDTTFKAKEGAYYLDVTPSGAKIIGFSEAGLFYGVQTFIQLLSADKAVVDKQSSEGVVSVQCAKVKDEPQFEYRGMHLDVVRHIFSIDYVKKYIDYIALHKMNYFHWHLTDDQGWRMESKSHPLLNEKGAYRDGTIIGLFPGTGVDSTRYGGYYTIEQIKEIVDYAAKRYITVVPEIDIPGHCMAVLATYPQFGTEPDKVTKPAITWGIYNRQNNVLAPSEEVFSFLEDVYNELMDLFPGKYIHMGADECAHKWWKESEKVQKFIKDNNLDGERGVSKYFAERVSKIIKARGRVAVGWDEMVDNGLVDDVVVMSWRRPDGAYRAAAQDHKAILTPQAFSYFNIQQKAQEDSVCHRGRIVSLDKVYKFNPLPDSLSVKQRENILGGQGALWTEYFPTIPKVEYGIFPRMSAIAEVYWSSPEVKNWPKFLLKLPEQFNRYDLWGANYSDFVFENECFSR